MFDGKKTKLFAGAIANPPPGILEVHYVKTAEGGDELASGTIAS